MKLSDICKYRSEKIELVNINKKEYVSTDNMLPNFAGIGELKSFPNSEKVNKYYRNDILLSNIRPYFKKMILSDKESGCSSDVLVIEVIDKEVNPKFLYYRLRNDDFFDYVILTSKGTKMPRGDKQAIMNFELELPDIKIQNKITRILDNIDKKIKVNNEINNNLHELLKKEYNEKFIGKKDSWLEDKLGNYLSIDRGLSYKGQFLSNAGVPMINLGNVMPNGVFRIEKNKYYSGEYKDKVVTKVGDIVIANTDMTQNRDVIGTPVIIPPIYNDKIIFSHHIYCLRDLKLPKMYIFYTLLTDHWNAAAGGNATGTTVLALPKETIENYNIIIPDKDTLELFDNIASNIQNKREQILLENIKLEQLRDTLLPKLMSGEINLDNIEI